ncbi:MAG: hypothetical protein QF718_07975 [Phycisphaerales bacterium]|jgi:hypothetical protein|nr:hypothetical protein [Phycisphaerales bacterium]
MSKNKKKKKGGYKPPAQSPQDIIDAIVSIAEKIFASDEAGPLWGELHKAFLKSDVDKSVAAKIIMHKDIDELRTVVAQLQMGGQVELSETEAAELPTLDHETQIEALRCFRKRVKFIKLDRESKLGVGPLSGGKEAKVDSMMAPHDYPMEVWLALAKDGHLVDDGGGFFHIPK